MKLGKLHTDCWPAWILLAILILSGIVLFYLNYNKKEGFLNMQQYIAMFRQQIQQRQEAQRMREMEIERQRRKMEMIGQYPKFLGYVFQNPKKSSDTLNDMKRRLFSSSCKFQYDWSKNNGGISYGADTPDKAREAYMGWMRCLADGISECYTQVNDANTRFMAPGCKPEVKSKAVLTDLSNVSRLFM